MGRRIFPKLIDSIMFKQPLVTVGIPFYNDSRFLPYAIQSVMNQTYQNWELILIDDGSKDNSLEVARGYENDKVRVYSDGTNKGLAARLNELSQLARGEFYARMDADDIMHPERLDFQVGYLMQHPETSLLGTSAYVIDASNIIIGGFHATEVRKPSTVDEILRDGGFIHPSIMGRTSWFQQHPYDVRLRRNQDRGLWLKTVEQSHFVTVPDKLLFYRMMGGATIKKEFLSYKSNWNLYCNVVGKEMGRKWTGARLYVKSVVKLTLRIILLLLGQKKLLAAKRYESYAEEELVNINQTFEKAITR